MLLDCRNLTLSCPSPEGLLRPVEDVGFSLEKGRVLGIVGESGCGKSLTALSLMGLTPEPGRVESGRILFEGRDLTRCSDKDMRKIRGSKMAMIFQEPMTALNPVYSIGRQLMEPLKLHRKMSGREARAEAVSLLNKVGIPAPERRFSEYSHQMSGGMRQRVMIAMALSCNPSLLIADEPTTALDVTIQAQILDLMRALVEETKTAIVFITHDMGVVAEMCQQSLVMYAGRVVEEAPAVELFAEPLHPYARGLLASIPPLDRDPDRLDIIPGTVPSLGRRPPGCRFHPRCRYALDLCRRVEPEIAWVGENRRVACHLHRKG
ncbi:MAG: ABC transporter ATP-binding protein [Pseudomonadota bacterium]